MLGASALDSRLDRVLDYLESCNGEPLNLARWDLKAALQREGFVPLQPASGLGTEMPRFDLWDTMSIRNEVVHLWRQLHPQEGN